MGTIITLDTSEFKIKTAEVDKAYNDLLRTTKVLHK